MQLRSLEVRATKVGPAEVGVVEFRTLEVDTAQVTPTKVGVVVLDALA